MLKLCHIPNLHHSHLSAIQMVFLLRNFRQWFSFLIFPSLINRAFSSAIFSRVRWLVRRWGLGDKFAHDGELEDGLFELVDAVFGGEQGVEVFGNALLQAVASRFIVAIRLTIW